MSDDSVKQKVAPEAQEPVVRFDLSIGEFCNRLKNDGFTRVLVDAFRAKQLAESKTQASESEFRAAFNKFAVLPA